MSSTMTTDPAREPLRTTSPEAVRAALRAAWAHAPAAGHREIALIDVREEDPFAQEHPLWAAQLSLARLEVDAPWRLPRRDVSIVVMDDAAGEDDAARDGQSLAETAARRLIALGYRDVSLLDGGLAGWIASGGELFRDVNVPSKSFGELVEGERHTPSLSADEVKARIEAGSNMVVLDARRYDEFSTMSIPTGMSVPGAELALRVRALAPDPTTQVIVNCAGRTRSIIGTQSLVNFGIPNPVAALRNGTIGWTLAGHPLDTGRAGRYSDVAGAARPAPELLADARARAGRLAVRAGARRLDGQGSAWREVLTQAQAAGRTVYRYDVRPPEDYAAGHLPGFGSAPGGQLVQETDMNCAVRGALILLVDGPADAAGQPTDGVRAAMTAHWLAQMGWEVAWLDGVPAAEFSDTSPWPPRLAAPAGIATLGATELAAALDRHEVLLLDLDTSARHVARHIPGAWWLLRSQAADSLARLKTRLGGTLPAQVVLTCADGQVSGQAATEIVAELAALCGPGVRLSLLAGGTAAWLAAGLPVEAGEQQLASPRIDRYRRPYEGTDAPRAAMQAYLDWEFGLIAQLGRDGTHGFRVLAAE